jgi:hypothetical protein
MSTRGIYTFKAFGETFHVYKHSDNYPTGAQIALANVLATGKAWDLPRFEADEFAAGFVAANKEGGGNVRLAKSRTAASDVEYGYTVAQVAGKKDIQLTVTSTDFWDNKNKETKLWTGRLIDFTQEVAAKLAE